MRSSMLGLGHPSQQYNMAPLPPSAVQRYPGHYDADPRNSLLLAHHHQRAVAADLAARQRALAADELRLARMAHLEAQMAQLVAEARLSAVTASSQAAHLEVLRAQQLQVPMGESVVSGMFDSRRPPLPSLTRYAPSLHGVALQAPPRPTTGLDLLTDVSIATGALPTKKSSSPKKEISAKMNRSDAASDASTAESVNDHGSGAGDTRLLIDSVAEWDVLCGRGGRSNHHPGNKRYRQVVAEMKLMYRSTETKSIKTDLSRAIVEHVWEYGGRFVKNDHKTGQFLVLTRAEARKKTSQALRETKALKWTL